jgi:hypothetical protein
VITGGICLEDVALRPGNPPQFGMDFVVVSLAARVAVSRLEGPSHWRWAARSPKNVVDHFLADAEVVEVAFQARRWGRLTAMQGAQVSRDIGERLRSR